MRLMKSAILFSVFMALAAAVSPAQNGPKQQSTKPPSTQAQPAQNFEFKTDISKMKIPVARKSGALQAHEPTYLMQKPDTAFDEGIYAGARGNMCGAIVSYNFSQGMNPQLESVTTCTPSNAVVQQRARGRKPAQSNTPQLLQTDFRNPD